MKDAAVVAEARAALLRTIAPIVGDAPLSHFDEALTHPSFANEHDGARDNQRLEFLGDAVLGLCVSEWLAVTHPDADEGKLTRMRSALVNAEALSRWARRVNLGPCIAVGRGAEASLEREQTNVLADAVEALIACVYESAGIESARKLALAVVEEVKGALAVPDARDPKSRLQEEVQAEGKTAPSYRVVETSGPAHEPHYIVEVQIEGEAFATGQGRSKRLAEKAAADAALTRRESLGAASDSSDDAK